MLSAGLPIEVAESDIRNARIKIASQLLEGGVADTFNAEDRLSPPYFRERD